MKHERIYLTEANEDAYIDTYIADPTANYTRKGLLVIPGGGYECVCSDREGEPIALAFLPYGFNCFVLHYTVARKRTFPAQLIEASAAMKHIKDNAEKYGLDPEKVFAVGFSAGGHLTGSLGTLWHLPQVYDALDMPYGYNKPAGILMIYPVVTADMRYAHRGSFLALSGIDDPTQEELEPMSLEKHVDERSAPLFLVHTSDDACVPVMNSLLMAKAYSAAGKRFELHVYPSAPHGMALGNDITAGGFEPYSSPVLSGWVKAAADWSEGV